MVPAVLAAGTFLILLNGTVANRRSRLGTYYTCKTIFTIFFVEQWTALILILLNQKQV